LRRSNAHERSQGHGHFELLVEVEERLDDLAKRADQPASSLATEAISSSLELQEWQIEEIHQGLREAQARDFATDEEVAAVFSKYAR
jgi:predicted transcriptional regulator